MNVVKLWCAQRGFLSEWEGRDDAGNFVQVRCKRELVELRAHADHMPGMDDMVDCVALEGYDSQLGPTYDQVRDVLVGRGHVLPDRDDGGREEIPERPPFPGYEGPGVYECDWSLGGNQHRVGGVDDPIPRLGFRVGAPTRPREDHDPPA